MRKEELREQDFVEVVQGHRGYIEKIYTQVLPSDVVKSGKIEVNDRAIISVDNWEKGKVLIDVKCEDIVKVLVPPFYYAVEYFYDDKRDISKRFEPWDLDKAKAFFYKIDHSPMKKRYSLLRLVKRSSEHDLLETIEGYRTISGC